MREREGGGRGGGTFTWSVLSITVMIKKKKSFVECNEK